jgi:NAD+-dependent secondary alcohol dehydrogenase Adh1
LIAARLHDYHQALKVDRVDEPRVTGPLDVIVKMGAAGLCRTDLHIQEGQWGGEVRGQAAVHAGP